MADDDEVQQPPRRGPGRPPKQPKPGDQAMSEQVTYVPGEEGPTSVKWAGHVFHANVPKTVEYIEYADEDAKPHPNKALVEKARGNRFFRVGAFDPNSEHPLPEGFTGEPKTSDQYRAHVVGWLKKTADINDMVQRWVSEANLREMCEFGSDDYIWLGSLFLPKMHDLAKQAGMNDNQLSALWQQHGVMQLPF